MDLFFLFQPYWEWITLWWTWRPSRPCTKTYVSKGGVGATKARKLLQPRVTVTLSPVSSAASAAGRAGENQEALRDVGGGGREAAGQTRTVSIWIFRPRAPQISTRHKRSETCSSDLQVCFSASWNERARSQAVHCVRVSFKAEREIKEILMWLLRPWLGLQVPVRAVSDPGLCGQSPLHHLPVGLHRRGAVRPAQAQHRLHCLRGTTIDRTDTASLFCNCVCVSVPSYFLWVVDVCRPCWRALGWRVCWGWCWLWGTTWTEAAGSEVRLTDLTWRFCPNWRMSRAEWGLSRFIIYIHESPFS